MIITNDQASICKHSMAKLGYYEDPYVSHFVKTPSRRTPVTNRGYYLRVSAIDAGLHAWVADDGPVQVASPVLAEKLLLTPHTDCSVARAGKLLLTLLHRCRSFHSERASTLQSSGWLRRVSPLPDMWRSISSR